MPHFTYINRLSGPVTHSTPRIALGREKYGAMVQVHAGEIVFECDADNILDADGKLLAATGLIAAKEMSLCVSF